MEIESVWYVVGGFFLVGIIILSRIIFGKTPDLDLSLGEKMAIVVRGEEQTLQMKCSLSAPKSPAIVSRMIVVVNSDTELHARQFIADFANPYVGTKAHIIPLKADPEVHEAIEFGSATHVAPRWRIGTNLLLVKVWIVPNTSRHSPSKMYRVVVTLDDHAVAQLARKGGDGTTMINVREITQVYPVPSFRLVKSEV